MSDTREYDQCPECGAKGALEVESTVIQTHDYKHRWWDYRPTNEEMTCFEIRCTICQHSWASEDALHSHEAPTQGENDA
jgi:hypothetical protein